LSFSRHPLVILLTQEANTTVAISLALIAIAVYSSKALIAFSGGAAEFLQSLALTATHTCGYRFQHLPIKGATCQVHESLEIYNVPLSEFLEAFPNAVVPQRVTPGLVIVRHTGPEPEILLLQTNRWFAKGGNWELPGGGVDWIPRETVLRAGQRELWEETGLGLASFDDYVGQYHFQAPWMLWMKDNLKIIFIGSVKGGDEGLKNIRLSRMEHEAFCWATESQIKEMSLHAERLVPLVMDGCEAMPEPGQWEQMAFISEEGKHYAIEAFNRLRN
jgi:8-oxo-dGTP pyrophosphatase MutT (NUDIX family)